MDKELKDNWRLRNPGIPDYIPPEKEKYYPACGHGTKVPDFIPDPQHEAELPDHMRAKAITPEQEQWGLHLEHKDKKRKEKPRINPIDGSTVR